MKDVIFSQCVNSKLIQKVCLMNPELNESFGISFFATALDSCHACTQLFFRVLWYLAKAETKIKMSVIPQIYFLGHFIKIA